MSKLKKFTAGYTVTPNEIINNENLSLKAVGLWSYINSKPDGWNFSAKGIASQVKDGVRAIGSGLRELEAEGYLERRNVHNDDGFAGTDYYLYDTDFRADTKRADTIRADTKRVDTKQLNSSNKDLSKPLISKKDEERSPSKKANKKTMFKNSSVFDLETFKEKLKKESELEVNIEYYYNSVLDWSEKKDSAILRTANGWIATARGFMRGDNDKNKLVKLVPADVSLENSKQAVDYLKM